MTDEMEEFNQDQQLHLLLLRRKQPIILHCDDLGVHSESDRGPRVSFDEVRLYSQVLNLVRARGYVQVFVRHLVDYRTQVKATDFLSAELTEQHVLRILNGLLIPGEKVSCAVTSPEKGWIGDNGCVITLFLLKRGQLPQSPRRSKGPSVK